MKLAVPMVVMLATVLTFGVGIGLLGLGHEAPPTEEIVLDAPLGDTHASHERSEGDVRSPLHGRTPSADDDEAAEDREAAPEPVEPAIPPPPPAVPATSGVTIVPADDGDDRDGDDRDDDVSSASAGPVASVDSVSSGG